MNPALQILAALIGAFYIFAGFQVLRMMLLDRMMDGLLTILEGKPRSPREKIRRVLLTGAAALTALSGAALASLSLWAAPLFLASFALQIVWLIWARTHYVPEDESEACGRRRTVNAAILYGTVTLGVLFLAARGFLLPWLSPLPLIVIAGVGFAGAGYAFRVRSENKGNTLEALADPDIDYPPPAPDGPQPRRVRIHTDTGAWALHDADDGRALPVFQYLPRSLAIRFDNWHTDFNDALDFDTPDVRAVFPSQTALDVFLNTGASLADALREIYGADNVEGPTFPVTLVVRTGDPEGGSVRVGEAAGLKELLGVERGLDGVLKAVFTVLGSKRTFEEIQGVSCRNTERG